MLVYIAISAFGLFFLLVMMFAGDVFGGDHDLHVEVGADHGDISHEGGPSIFSGRIMAAFLTAFGAGGAMARYYDLSHLSAAGVGTAFGAVFAWIVYQFARFLYSQQASSELRMGALVGRSAEVTVAIPEHGVGQVTLTFGGERTTHIARSADGSAIQNGTEVVIEALRGDSMVIARAGGPGRGGA